MMDWLHNAWDLVGFLILVYLGCLAVATVAGGLWAFLRTLVRETAAAWRRRQPRPQRMEVKVTRMKESDFDGAVRLPGGRLKLKDGTIAYVAEGMFFGPHAFVQCSGGTDCGYNGGAACHYRNPGEYAICGKKAEEH